jgi:hypothetical protein
MRRLRALAVLDPEVGAVIGARDDRRRLALRTLLGRRADVADLPYAVRVSHVLTSFETFDAVLGPRQRPGAAVSVVVDMIRAALRAGAGG